MLQNSLPKNIRIRLWVTQFGHDFFHSRLRRDVLVAQHYDWRETLLVNLSGFHTAALIPGENDNKVGVFGLILRLKPKSQKWQGNRNQYN